MSFIKKITNALTRHKYFVIADPADNSVTLSKKVCDALGITNWQGEENPKAFAFKDTSTGLYAFCLAPDDLPDGAPVSEVQFNTKCKSIGFAPLTPTVNRVFYDYGLTHSKPCKLTVTEHTFTNEQGATKVYFSIEKPNGKCTIQHA